MSKLEYQKEVFNDNINVLDYDDIYLKSEVYHVPSLYDDERIKNTFLKLKYNVVDLNPALVTKCIQGTDQDFLMLMKKAKEFLQLNFKGNESTFTIIMDLFQECVFGYYVLTPLIRTPDVSDIKVLAWNHIVCKSNGKRYVTDISFNSPEDYDTWFERLIRIHRLAFTEDNSLQHCTDRKGVDNFYLRIDLQLPYIVSTETNNIHIRKIPKEKYSWNYLVDAGMLDRDIIDYSKDRVAAGYSFLISGKGGSGKTSYMNNLIDLIPFGESILVSQESDELYSNVHPQMQFEHTIEVKRNGITKEYTLEDELRLGLLQDIDNFIIGEIKGGEALNCFTTAMSTGARFMGTIHSNSAASSVTRLAQLARYVSDYSMESLLEMLSGMKLVLVYMKYFSVVEILEIGGWDKTASNCKYNTIYVK
jgi:pilus assembly protein CpaF